MQAAVLITFWEIFGRRPTRSDLHAVLKQYQRREVVLFLATLNCLLRTWQNDPEFDLDSKLADLVLKAYKQKIHDIRTGEPSKLLFSRIGLLYLVKQACDACPEIGAPVGNDTGHADIGLCCLMANDLLLPFLPSSTDSVVHKIANLLPFTDYVAQDNYAMDIARTQMMFDDISRLPSIKKRNDFIDLQDLFQDKMGVSCATFCELVFGTASKLLNITIEDVRYSFESMVIRSSFFAPTGLPTNTVSCFFQKVATPEPELARRMRAAAHRPGDDLTLFQQSPITEIADGVYCCVDPGFLIDKAGRGLYWTLFTEIPEDGLRARLSSFWGAVFEEYINYILAESYGAGGRFVPSPRFPNGDEAFDACIVEGRDLVVFEYKSSTLRADAKYGGDAEKLKAELHRKYVEGDGAGESAKGLAQLRRSIERFLRGEPLGNIDAGSVSRIFPAMVCLESAVSVPFVALYFKNQFHAMFPRKAFRQTVTPVFTLGISDVERLLSYLGSFSLSDIFESYYSKNKTMHAPFSHAEIPLIKHAKPGENIIMDRFSRFAQEMHKHFFGEPGASGEQQSMSSKPSE